MFLPLVKMLIASFLNEEALKSLSLFILQTLVAKFQIKRPLTDEEKKTLADAHKQSMEEGNSLHYEQALNPNRNYPAR